jgi:hypothetical protein
MLPKFLGENNDISNVGTLENPIGDTAAENYFNVVGAKKSLRHKLAVNAELVVCLEVPDEVIVNLKKQHAG